MLEDTSNQPSKFRTKKWVEINDESRKTYSVNRQISFKISMRDAYILVKGNVTGNNTGSVDTDANNTNKQVIFKNCARFTYCINK